MPPTGPAAPRPETASTAGPASNRRAPRSPSPSGKHASRSSRIPPTGGPPNDGNRDCVVVVGSPRLPARRQLGPQRAGREVDRGPRHRERAFEHRAIGRRVDARAPRTRAGDSPRRPLSIAMHGWIDGIASETLPMSVENVIVVLVVGTGGRSRPRWRGTPSTMSWSCSMCEYVGRHVVDRRASRRSRARRLRSSARSAGVSSLELVDRAARGPSTVPSVCAGTMLAASPPCVTMPCTWSSGGGAGAADRSRPARPSIASAGVDRRARARRPRATRWPVYVHVEVRDRAARAASRSSSGAGCTIIAACDAVERAALEQEHLAAAALFGRRADHADA